MSKLLEYFRSGQRSQPDHEPSTPGPATRREYAQHRHATADFTEAEDDDDDTNDEGRQRYPSQRHADRDEDGDPSTSNVLPLFSASHLGLSYP
jgi:hypothetical protein